MIDVHHERAVERCPVEARGVQLHNDVQASAFAPMTILTVHEELKYM